MGPTKLLWHRNGLNSQQLQVLKKSSRGFPFAPRRDGGVGGGADPAPDAPAEVLEAISGQAHVDAVSTANNVLKRLQEEGGTVEVIAMLVSFVESNLGNPSLDDLALEVATASLFWSTTCWPCSDISKPDQCQRLEEALFHHAKGQDPSNYIAALIEVVEEGELLTRG